MTHALDGGHLDARSGSAFHAWASEQLANGVKRLLINSREQETHALRGYMHDVRGQTRPLGGVFVQQFDLHRRVQRQYRKPRRANRDTTKPEIPRRTDADRQALVIKQHIEQNRFTQTVAMFHIVLRGIVRGLTILLTHPSEKYYNVKKGVALTPIKNKNFFPKNKKVR